MIETFDTASALAPAGDGRFAWQVPDGWQQGKGAFGGLVLGTLLRAMEACEPEAARRTRSLSGELPAPALPVATEITVEILRRGGGTTFLTARATQGGATVARASALCASSRPTGAARGGLSAPRLPPPNELVAAPPPAVGTQLVTAAVTSSSRSVGLGADASSDLRSEERRRPAGGSGPPPFTRHYEYRPTAPLPYSGAEVAAANGWLCPRTPPARLDGPALIGLLDAWWPTSLACEIRPRPMATVTFTAELLADPATLDAAAPFAYRARLDGVADGFSVEVRELWQDGVLVALNQQVFAFLA